MILENPLRIGHNSVGYQLTEQAMVFGGETLTGTDIAVAGGLAQVGDPRNSDGNPDSPQTVVFLTSIIDVTVGY